MHANQVINYGSATTLTKSYSVVFIFKLNTSLINSIFWCDDDKNVTSYVSVFAEM